MIDTENRESPICPHCGHENSTEMLHPTMTRVVMGCRVCGGAMDVVKNVTITFTTTKLSDAPVGAVGGVVSAQPERAMLIQMVQRDLIARGSKTLEVTEEMITAKNEQLIGGVKNFQVSHVFGLLDFCEAKASAGQSFGEEYDKAWAQALHIVKILGWNWESDADLVGLRHDTTHMARCQAMKAAFAKWLRVATPVDVEQMRAQVDGPQPSCHAELLNFLVTRTQVLEHGHLKLEAGLEMTDAQCAEMNTALGIHMGGKKDKSYRPYCLRCQPGPRVALTDTGFKCWYCGNKFGFDLVRHDVEPG